MIDDNESPMLIDDGMSPAMREIVFLANQSKAREDARREALKRRPPPPDGQEYLDVAAARISDLKGYPTKVKLGEPDKRFLLSKRLLAAIAGGLLRARSASLDLPVDPGGKIDPDDCLVEVGSLAEWAGVDLGQQQKVNAATDVAATSIAKTPDVPKAKRRDAIAPLIEKACREVGWPWEVEDVFSTLTAWASAEPPIRPLLTATVEAILYEDEGHDKLTKVNLGHRLRRMRDNVKAATQPRPSA